ncbi:MAG: site-specific integrase, partial [Acidobacteriota bacterium]
MSQTLHPAAEQFLEHLRAERNYSAHTLRNYRSDLEAFFRAVNLSSAVEGKSSRKGKPSIAVDYFAVDYLKIREYLGQMYARRRKPATVARKLAALRSFYRYACREGLVKENPAKLVASPRLPQMLPDVMTAEETNHLIDAVGKTAASGKPGAAALVAR